MALTKEELGRKLLHILSGLGLPAVIYYVPRIPQLPSYTAILTLVILLAGSFAVEFARFKIQRVQNIFYKFFGSVMRKEESCKITGSTWIFASALICALIYPPPVAAIVICLFVLGDGIAAIAGLSFGRIRIGNKSLEGSLCCFFCCLILFRVLFPKVPGLLDLWGGSLPLSIQLLLSLVITLLELFPFRLSSYFVINDNLVVPVFAGAVLTAITKLQ